MKLVKNLVDIVLIVRLSLERIIVINAIFMMMMVRKRKYFIAIHAGYVD